MIGIYLQSLQASKVIQIRPEGTRVAPGSSLDAASMKLNFIAPGVENTYQGVEYQLWNCRSPGRYVLAPGQSPADFNPPFYIESASSPGLVIEVGAIDPRSDRGPALHLDTNRTNNPMVTNQLWKFVQPNPAVVLNGDVLNGDDVAYYFIQSLLSPEYVVDIREEDPHPGTIQVYRMKKSNADNQNQLWTQNPFAQIDIYGPGVHLTPPSVVAHHPGFRITSSHQVK